MDEPWDPELQSRVRAGLRADASTLEPRADWDEVLRLVVAESEVVVAPETTGPGDGGRHWLAVGAVVAVVGVAALVVGRGGVGEVEVTDTERTKAPTSVPATPTTIATASAGLYFDVDWNSLPDRGVIVVAEDGRSSLFDLDGEQLASSDASVDALRIGSGAPGVVVVEPDAAGSIASRRAADPLPAPAPAGCEQPDGFALASSAGTDAQSFSVCGAPKPREIWRSVAGVTDVVSGPPTSALEAGSPAGHWADAVPSPDGRWILGQWSGECEAPQAFLLPAAGGVTRALGIDAAAGAAPASQHLGWTPDGRILAMYPAASCGEVAEQPGVYLEDPATGARTLVIELRGPSEVIAWTKGHDAPTATGEPEGSWGAVQEDVESGAVTAPGFNEFVRANRPRWAREPGEAVEVLLGLDARADAEVDIAVAPSDGDRIELIVTLTGLMDDSAAAIRYDVTLIPDANGLLLLDSARWSQQCRRGTDTTSFRPGFCP